ncbi:phage integrase [Microbulbifer spongiae]|uniref:Tyrosine-type recombinase/integrase n=1 Tax=Microbulbifer spongiae TaxID=2944933 RepID=A0ABY9EAH3_9GAMM|nr:tyrosine-type recombinase/integrase [Microbulbifer sp. MI-G]WKD48365.1 tyrosine-type recombinase/integrase [Microbulbifer sp. MI-G]
MAIRKVTRGWQVDIQPEGRGGRRVRRTFQTKRAAEQFKVEQKALANTGEWRAPEREHRRLLDLVVDWFDLYGFTLKDGENRKTKLISLCERLGNPRATNITGESWLRYRKKRLEQYSQRGKPINPNTVNHEHAYLSAMFGTLIKLRSWKRDNPLRGIPKIKLDEPDLIYLELEEIVRLLDELAASRNLDVLVITKLCLATGARWGEAQRLEAQRLRNGQVHFIRTKNSKARAIPIAPELEAEVRQGRPQTGPLFRISGYDAFKHAVSRANICLPDGQLTHVLRHTFASHFMINDGNILKLKDILGHKTLAMTMRYAKLAPRHLSQALEKNPLQTIQCQQSVNAVMKKDPKKNPEAIVTF